MTDDIANGATSTETIIAMARWADIGKRTERPGRHFFGRGPRGEGRSVHLAHETTFGVSQSGLLGFVATLHFTVGPNRFGMTRLPYFR